MLNSCAFRVLNRPAVAGLPTTADADRYSPSEDASTRFRLSPSALAMIVNQPERTGGHLLTNQP